VSRLTIPPNLIGIVAPGATPRKAGRKVTLSSPSHLERF